MPPIGRRTVLKLVAGTVIGGAAWAALPKAPATPFRTGKSGGKDGSDSVVAQDTVLAIAFDRNLHTRLVAHGKPLTPYQPGESLLLADGAIEDFTLTGQREQQVTDARHGAGHQWIVTGRSDRQLEKEVTVTFFDSLPGFAVLQTRYRNLGDAPLRVAGWRNVAHELADAPDGFWSFAGATHTDRRDWVRPLGAGFDQRNTLGMDSSDYGGGIPMADIWRRDVGLAVGHVDPGAR